MESFATFHVLNCKENTLKTQLHNIVHGKIQYIFEGNSLPKTDQEFGASDKDMVNILQFAKTLNDQQKVLTFDALENSEDVKSFATLMKMILSYKPNPDYYNYVKTNGSISVFSDNIRFENAMDLVIPLDFYNTEVIICGCYKTELMYFYIVNNNEIIHSIIYGENPEKYGLSSSIIDCETFCDCFNCESAEYEVLLTEISSKNINAFELCNHLEKITNLPINPNGETMLNLQMKHKVKRYKVSNR